MKTCLWLLLLLTASRLDVEATFVGNGSFESGDLRAWNYVLLSGTFYSVPDGHLAQPDPPYPSRDAATVPWLQGRASMVSSSTAPMGSCYAQVYNAQYEVLSDPFLGPNGVNYRFNQAYYTTALEQSVFMQQGDILTGYAAFGTYDWMNDGDRAFVQINGQTIWNYDANSLEGLEAWHLTTGPWQQWSFTAPTSGNYLIDLGVRGGDMADCIGYFDGIRIEPVPESSPMLFGLLLVLPVAAHLLRHRESQ